MSKQTVGIFLILTAAFLAGCADSGEVASPANSGTLQAQLSQCSQMAASTGANIDPVTKELYELDGDTTEYETMVSVEKNLADIKTKIDVGPASSDLLTQCKTVTKSSATQIDPIRQELIELDGPATDEVKTLQTAEDQLNSLS